MDEKSVYSVWDNWTNFSDCRYSGNLLERDGDGLSSRWQWPRHYMDKSP